MYKCFGLWLAADRNRQPIRIRAAELPHSFSAIFELNEDSAEGKCYVNPKPRHQRSFEKCFDDKYSFALAFRAIRNGEEIEKEIRLLFRETEKKDWLLAFKANVRTELLQSAIVPAFRDPQNQLRLSSWTWYGKLMQHLTAGHMRNLDLQAALRAVRNVSDEIFSSVREQVRQSTLEVAFPGTELSFQFNADNQFDLYKTCALYVDDGFKSLLTDKGSGLQSAVIIGLFSYYTKYVSVATSKLLCIEEPELYLHPHARRLINDRLTDFIADKNQVIVTTHSADFLRSSGEEVNVIALSRTPEGVTKAVSVNLRDYSRFLVQECSSELFFAETVIVCEGFDDFVVRAIARELFPKQLDSNNVSVISSGGKDKIAEVVKLILKLGIRCYVIADFDYLLRDRSDDRLKYGDVKAHDSVVTLDPAFFCQSCIYGELGGDVLKGLQTRRTKIRQSQEREFYIAKSAGQVSEPSLTEYLRELRKHGVGILSRELEDFCKDGTISDIKKLSLNRVFELNGRLANGEKISDILDITEIVEVLTAVLE